MPAAVTAVLGPASPAARAFAPLTHGGLNPTTGGVWRVTGPAGSAVLKRCVPAGLGTWAGSSDPRHWNHWRREPLAYRDGLPATAYAAAGIDGPGLLAAEEHPDGSFDLWLEDVVGLPGSRWPVSLLADFAHALGRAQAAWTDPSSLAGPTAGTGSLGAASAALPTGSPRRTDPLLDRPWLSRRWLRQYVAIKPLSGPIPWDHPAAVARWPATLRAGLRRMWEQRELLLSAAESSPRTLCHLDVWPLNLIAPHPVDTAGLPNTAARAGAAGGNRSARDGRGGAMRSDAGRGRIVLLDWAFVGEGGVGEDIANLIPDCVADGLMPPELLPEISESVITGYLSGLRAAGRGVDEGRLRRWVAAAGAAKYCWLAPLMLTRLAAGVPVGSASYDVGGDDKAVMRRRTGLLKHLVAWSEQTLG